MENKGYYANIYKRFPEKPKEPDPRLQQKDCHLVLDVRIANYGGDHKRSGRKKKEE